LASWLIISKEDEKSRLLPPAIGTAAACHPDLFNQVKNQDLGDPD
jgi:hypothetical protein